VAQDNRSALRPWLTPCLRSSHHPGRSGTSRAVVPVFERFFHPVASLTIDKSDIRRFRSVVDEQIDASPLPAGTRPSGTVNPATHHWERVFTLFRLMFGPRPCRSGGRPSLRI
jgi:hypothetical protein